MRPPCEPGFETFPVASRLMPQIVMWSEAMGTKSGKELAKDLDTLRQDVSALAEHLSGFLSDKGDLVERLFNKLKQFRRVATRYDKLLVNFMGFVKLAAIAIK
jgi:hypothetical protein